MFIIFIVDLLVILLCPLYILCSIDYLLFENFDLTKNTFVEEQKLFQNVLNIRNSLNLKCKELDANSNYDREQLKNIKHKQTQLSFGKNLLVLRKIANAKRTEDNVIHSKSAENNLEISQRMYLDIRKSINLNFGFEKIYVNNTETQLIIAALKGLMMLQDTYGLDIKHFSKGELNIKSKEKVRYRNMDTLQLEDLVSMSGISFNHLHWYDASIRYLKEAANIFVATAKETYRNSLFRNILDECLNAMKKLYPAYHNKMLDKMDNPIGTDYKLFPLPIDEDDLDHNKKLELGEMRTSQFQNICNGKIKSKGHIESIKKINESPKCYLLHHHSPYLTLGPFHLDVKMYSPFRSVYRDFFTDKEMRWMIEYSLPRLSATRELPKSTLSKTKAEFRQSEYSKRAFGVAKTVQTWFNDVDYKEKPRYETISSEGQPLDYRLKPLKDPYTYSVSHAIMHSVSRKIEAATNFNVTTRHGASMYQTTNYGLSGMVYPHMDPFGYESGKELKEHPERIHICATGDYIATFMGWFETTEAGGNTAFMADSYEGVIEPKAGDAALWINLFSSHSKDSRSSHAGCPVLKGSKWILNKWINSWDQWKMWPCILVPNTSIIPPFRYY